MNQGHAFMLTGMVSEPDGKDNYVDGDMLASMLDDVGARLRGRPVAPLAFVGGRGVAIDTKVADTWGIIGKGRLRVWQATSKTGGTIDIGRLAASPLTALFTAALDALMRETGADNYLCFTVQLGDQVVDITAQVRGGKVAPKLGVDVEPGGG